MSVDTLARVRRILLLITDLEIGGTPTVVRELAVRLTAAGGAAVEAACLAGWGPVAEQLQQAGVAVTALGARNARDLPLTLVRLRRLIRRRKIDTVFSFLMHANTVAAATSLLMRGVRWLQSVQTTQPNPHWHWWVQAVAQQAAERVVVPSDSAARAAMHWSATPPEKIVVIPNAVEMPADLATDSPPPTSRPPGVHSVVGFIGRLDPVKRIGDLVEAMAYLEDSIRLEIFGAGAEQSAIQLQIRRLNLGARVALNGAIERPWAALARMDVLVLPSRAEGFGLVLIEAMAAGVPVVASNVAGIRDVVRHGQTGLLVPVGSPTEIAHAIKRLLSEEALRSRLTTAAAEDVRRRFSWKRVLPMYRRLLQISG